VVFARTDLWAREIQVQQSLEAFKRSEARREVGIGDIAELSQARAALAQFRASAIAARANLLTREAALANILGLPPTEPYALQPTTPPTESRIAFDWNLLTDVAQRRRPDVIELKLILEADQQRLLLARNQMQPNLDLVGLYRWNGLEGRMPNQSRIGTNGNEATDWTLGVNFSVPLLLRQERATVRSAELLIARDRANLEQGIHSMRHSLALTYRNLEAQFQQYEAYTEAREAARINLERQFGAYQVGGVGIDTTFLNVLQAISDWGNSVSLQAQTLMQYNIELANLERQTGTILETHGVFMYEDRTCSVGPLWIDPKRCVLYPRDIHPGPNEVVYPAGSGPSEEVFDLEDYPQRLPPLDRLPDLPGVESIPDVLPPGSETFPEETLPEPLPPSDAVEGPALEYPPSVGHVPPR
jgi:outer membrane protein TolC